MRRLFLMVGFGLFFLLSHIALAASPLDGTQWRVEITPKGATIPSYVDLVSFDEGKFNSAIFARKGFAASQYTETKKEGGIIIWEVTQASENEGSLAWRGELKENAMSGTMVWKQASGKVVNHTFTGGIAPEEPAPEPPASTPTPEPKPEAPAPKAKKTPAPKSKAAPPQSP